MKMEPLRVTIGDHEYLLKSDGDEEEILRLAEYVNTKLREADDPEKRLTEKKTAILAALSIAGDYFKVIKERDELRSTVRIQTEALIRHIDSAMDESLAAVGRRAGNADPARPEEATPSG
ncbi:MAG: cell division protein ZapA [Deltaproteobacteria bacterium]|nr:cell division protein ZapA [Deltaproteobacteria bacterium]